MTRSRIPLLVPDMPLAEELLPWLKRIDATRWYSNFGPLVRELEVALIGMFALRSDKSLHLTTVSNCTVGLELALIALDLKPGSKVLVPALTFVATATAVIRAGHVPVIADVDARSWLLTPAIARAALRSTDLAAVLPVATFGCPHDMREWDAFQAETGLPVVIDVAGAFGNQWKCGSATLVFSLHATKSLAAGEGGLVISRDFDLIARIRKLSNFGINLDPHEVTPVGQVEIPGINAKMSEYHAAIGLANLARWPDLSAARIELFGRYSARLDSLPGLTPAWQQVPTGIVRTLLCFRVRPGGLREAIEVACAAAGIETRRWYLPTLNRHHAFAELPRAGPLHESDRLCEELVGLPFHAHLAPTHIDAIVGAVSRAVGPAN